MIKVRLVTNDGNGMPQDIRVREGATIGDLLGLHFNGEIEDFTIQIRQLEQTSRTACEDDVLEEGDRISLAPRKVEGAK